MEEDEKLSDAELEDIELEREEKEGFYQADTNAESDEETQRKGLMAYGAISTLIGAILIFLAVGWLIDKTFGTSPWGIVAGILLGSFIGFYQFIRISAD